MHSFRRKLVEPTQKIEIAPNIVSKSTYIYIFCLCFQHLQNLSQIQDSILVFLFFLFILRFVLQPDLAWLKDRRIKATLQAFQRFAGDSEVHWRLKPMFRRGFTSIAFVAAEALEYGIVSINNGLPTIAEVPFGGVKESGMGREGSRYGLDDYLTIKYISMGGI